MWELVLLTTNQSVPLSLGREYYVGTGATAHIRLSAADVSHTHALICVARDHLRVVDLGSKNGTYVNGKRITSAIVHSGDTVAFSSVKAQVVLATEVVPPSPEKPSVEKPTSHTGEFPVVPAEEDVVGLLRSWDVAPESAMHSFLCWLVAHRRALGCALLEFAQGQGLVVVASQGQLPQGVIADPGLAQSLAGLAGPEAAWEVHHFASGDTSFLLSLLGEGAGLLLLPGSHWPSAQELELVARLARLAMRLSGYCRPPGPKG